MRSLGGKNPHAMVLLTLALLVFFSWSGIAQEVKDLERGENEAADRVPFSASFDLVTPLNKEIITGKGIIILSPSDPGDDAVAAVQIANDQVVYESKFTATENWMHAFDSTSLRDGSYSLVISFCTNGSCEEKKIEVTISNARKEPSSGETPSAGTTDPVTDPETKPSDPITPVPVESFLVIPSNHAGAFYLSDRLLDFEFKSSGDSLKIAAGQYDAAFEFFEGRVATIKIQGAKIDHEGVIAQWEEQTITQPIHLGNTRFEPVESYSFQFGYSAEQTTVHFSPLPEYAFILCRAVERDQGTCARAEVLDEEADNPLISTTDSEMVVVFAKRVHETTSEPRFHTIIPSNYPSTFIFENVKTKELRKTTHESIELETGEYDVNAYFEDLPIRFAHIRSMVVDRNAVLLQFPFIQRSPEGIVTLSLDEPFAFSSGFFAIHPRYDGGSIWTCAIWNAAARDCLGDWKRTYETRIEKGTMFLRFYPFGVDANEGVTLPEVPDNSGISDEVALLRAIARLKDLSKNSAFFKNDSALIDFTILSMLFSDIEVSLECDPKKLIDPVAPSLPTADIKPVVTTPANADDAVPQDSDTTETSADIIVEDADENIVLSFQAENIIPEIFPQEDSRDSIDSDRVEIENANLPLFEEPKPRPSFEEKDDRFSSEWEESKPERSASQENLLECDGVTLENEYVEQLITDKQSRSFSIGDVRSKVKQILTLTNQTFIEQERAVHVRLIARTPAIVSERKTIIPSSDYTGLRSKLEVETVVPAIDDVNAPLIFVERLKHVELDLVDENAGVIGKYNWKDYWDANTLPVTLIHAGKQGMIIDTLIQVKLDPASTRVIDPTYELTDYPNFSVGWDGNNSGDKIGSNIDSNEGIQVVNLDNNVVANDLIIVAPLVDYNGKLDAGAIYIIKDINTLSGLKGLADTNNYSVAFFGGAAYDYLGRTGIAATGTGPGVQLLDTDGNGYANDLIISAINADVNGKTDVGGIYYIKDVDKLKGSFGLASMNGVSLRWNGTSGGDRIGYTVQGGLGVQVHNLDANYSANDLVIGGAQINVSSGSDNGAVYIIKDINTIGGPIDVNRMKDLNHTSNFSVRFDANTIASDNLTNTSLSGRGINVINSDRNIVANDLIIGSTLGDANGKADAGKVYYIKDVNTLSGIRRFDTTTSYQSMWHGGASWGLGSTSGSGNGIQILDLNGDQYYNDLLVVANQGDFNGKSDNGVLFLITDINTITGTFDLNTNRITDYHTKWYSGTNTDRIGYTSSSNTVGGMSENSIQVVNTDGNRAANDLIIIASVADFNAKTNAGIVYLVKDINRFRGNYDLNVPASYSILWHGEAASDFTGRNNNPSQSVQVVNIDGNAFPNDLIITSMFADVNGKTNGGGIYLITDINAKSGLHYLGNFSHITARWNGAASDFLGDTNGGRQGVQLVNVDNNAWANDLLINGPNVDANGSTDNGVVYLIRDINRAYSVGPLTRSFDLNSIAQGMFAVRWYLDGNRQFLGDTNKSGQGAILADTDNNGYTNDLILTASKADKFVLGEGRVFYIRDIDKLDGNKPLSHTDNFFSEFSADTNYDGLGDTNSSGAGVLIVDVDGNGYANDLIIAAYNKDVNVLGQADKNLVFANGGVFLIKDIVQGNPSTGTFNYSFNTPGVDANVYGVGNTIVVNATVFCRGTACGNVDTNLQYCVGNSCQSNHFVDMNTVAGSPLYILTGSATQSQASLARNGSYDVNWTITGANDYNYELRLTSIGTTALRSYSDGLDRTIVLEPSNSFDFGRRSSYYSRYFGSLNNDAFGFARNTRESVSVVNLDNGVYANDLIVTASQADLNGKADNGAIYIIRNIDVNRGELDINNTNYFDLRIQGGAASDFLGATSLAGSAFGDTPGVIVANLDGNTYANDLIIAAPNADANGKSDNGAIYVVKDVDRKTGIRDLGGDANAVDLRISGSLASDNLGLGQHSGKSIQVVNLDGNVVANDLIIVTPRADINSKSNNGAVYIIKDINTLRGSKDLNILTNANTTFMGGMASDQIGLGENGTDSVRLVNLDGNAWGNDLIIASYVVDANGKSNTGGIYIKMDVNVLSGRFDFNNTNNYDFRFSGGMAGDGLPQIGTPLTGNDINAWALVNLDGNAWANDLLIAAYAADYNGKTDVGALYVVKDINALRPGLYDFNNVNNFHMIITGSRASDLLTQNNGVSSFQSSNPFELVNIDGGAYSNDLYVISGRTDFLRTNSGSVYILQNIDTNRGRFDLNVPTNFRSRFDGGIASDALGDTNANGPAVQIVNWDGGSYTNDMILNVPFGDYNNRANTGIVYYVRNIDGGSGVKDLNQAATFQTKWSGGTAGDAIGDANRSGYGVKIVNLDNEATANDLLITSTAGDFNTKLNNGGIFMILDANTASGDDPLSVSANYTARWSGQGNNDFIGTSAQEGVGSGIFNLDNNAYANDLIITAPAADLSLKTDNGVTYIIQDANNATGDLGLESKAVYTKRFVGRLNGNNLGAAWFGTGENKPIDLDNNSYTNDMLFNSPYSDSNGKVNNGNITLVQNVLSVGAETPNDYSFVLMLPSNSCGADLGNQEGADGPCHRAWIETTDVIGLADQNQVQPDGQSNGTPFLVYDNQSTTSSDLNILLDLNEALPVTLILKVSTIFNGWAANCTGDTDTNCLQVTTTATSVGRALYSAGTQDLNLYVWGDFNSATTGRLDRNVDSNSIAS